LRRALRMVTLAWVFGAVWQAATAGAPLTLFARHLGAGPFEFGVLAALPFLASLLSLPASLLTERTGNRKGVFLLGLYPNRLLWFAIALVPLWVVGRYGMGPALAAFIGLTFLMHCGQSAGSPAWVGWMADVVPERVRGKYFSRRRQWGILSAVPTALLVGWVLDRSAAGHGWPVPITCAAIFMVAAVAGTVDIALFHAVPEPHKPPRDGWALLRAMRAPLRDRQFLWFAGFVATLVFAVSFMGQFVTLYAIERAQFDNRTVQFMLLTAPLLAQLLVLPAWGRAVDRMGKKPVMKISALGFAPLALGWMFLHAGNVWYGYLLSAVGAALWAGVEIANFNFVIGMSGSGDGSDGETRGTSYAAVNAVIVNVAGCAGGLVGGGIAELLKGWSWQPLAAARAFTYYDVLFVLSFALRLLAAVVFLPHLHEPTAKPARETIKFMTSNIYNNLYHAVLQPVRLVRGRLRGAESEQGI